MTTVGGMWALLISCYIMVEKKENFGYTLHAPGWDKKSKSSAASEIGFCVLSLKQLGQIVGQASHSCFNFDF